MKRLMPIIIAAAVVIAGCAEVREYAQIVRNDTLSPAYRAALETWTRSKTVYSSFETRLKVVATYRSAQFQKAYREEYDRVCDGSVRLDATAPQGMEFLVYAYTPNREANDFADARSIWEVFMAVNGGERFVPVDLRRIEDVTPAMEEFFPYINRHHGSVYTVTFNSVGGGTGTITPRTDDFSLVFASVLGRAELDW